MNWFLFAVASASPFAVSALEALPFCGVEVKLPFKFEGLRFRQIVILSPAWSM